MDDISSPKTLPCGHTFCADCINNYLDNYKQACPTCGKVCGIIKGDQPDGDMTVNFRSYEHCAGYEDVGRIDITYSFPGGHQKVIEKRNCRLHYINTLKQELNGTKAYEELTKRHP